MGSLTLLLMPLLALVPISFSFSLASECCSSRGGHLGTQCRLHSRHVMEASLKPSASQEVWTTRWTFMIYWNLLLCTVMFAHSFMLSSRCLFYVSPPRLAVFIAASALMWHPASRAEVLPNIMYALSHRLQTYPSHSVKFGTLVLERTRLRGIRVAVT